MKLLIVENNLLEEIKYEISDKLLKSQSTTVALTFPKLL